MQNLVNGNHCQHCQRFFRKSGEWFDWYIYASFTIYFAPSFSSTPDHEAIECGGVFAVGF